MFSGYAQHQVVAQHDHTSDYVLKLVAMFLIRTRTGKDLLVRLTSMSQGPIAQLCFGNT